MLWQVKARVPAQTFGGGDNLETGFEDRLEDASTVQGRHIWEDVFLYSLHVL